jgi:hypothetical protein
MNTSSTDSSEALPPSVIRIITDRTDPVVSRIIAFLEKHFEKIRGTVLVTTVSNCSANERTKCLTRRRCNLVVALFASRPDETTASAVSACAQCLQFSCGSVLVLEPEGVSRNLTLPDRKIIRRHYSSDESVLLEIAESFKQFLEG